MWRLVAIAALLASPAFAQQSLPSDQQEFLAKLQQRLGALEMENVQLGVQVAHLAVEIKALGDENEKLKVAARPSEPAKKRGAR